MVTYSSLYPTASALVSRAWFKTPGAASFVVPGGVTHTRAHALGCGGQGDQSGGGGAFARRTLAIPVGELLSIQVGNTSTAGISGDSWVKRPGGVVFIYADRGRGIGTGGQASLSIGDITLSGLPATNDGSTTIFGDPASDAALNNPVFGAGKGGKFGGPGSLYGQSADYGGGGYNRVYNADYSGFYAWVPAGTGIVCLEFYNGDPGV